MKRLAWCAMLLTLWGCRSGPVDRALIPPSPEASASPEGGNFLLYVSNQSFARRTVDIEVTLDGRPALARDFAVEGQHTFVKFAFDLEPGGHELRARSRAGEADLVRRFETKGTLWGLIQYWCCDPAQGDPRFTFDTSNRPLAFD